MLFAQLTWWDFSNFGSIRLAEPLPIPDLLYLALDKYDYPVCDCWCSMASC